MATFEEKWEQFKSELQKHVPDWNTQFLNWADARGFGFGGGFFNEFPHTHTYETDLSWLISRMKWVLFRVDTVEERMKLLEDLLKDFVETLDIGEIIKEKIIEYFRELLEAGTFEQIIREIFNELITRIERLADNAVMFPDDDMFRITFNSSHIASYTEYTKKPDGTLVRTNREISGSFPFGVADFGKFISIGTFTTESPKVTPYIARQLVLELNDAGADFFNSKLAEHGYIYFYNGTARAYDQTLTTMCGGSTTSSGSTQNKLGYIYSAVSNSVQTMNPNVVRYCAMFRKVRL